MLLHYFQGAISRIEQKMPEIDRVINEVDQLCQKPYMYEEDRVALHGKSRDLNIKWDEMRKEALQKETEYEIKKKLTSRRHDSKILVKLGN